jgi:predicted transport protein
MKVTINLSDEELKILKKRAKKNLLSLREQIEDIVRRSCVNYKERTNYRAIKVDDKLVAVFSREKRGRKKKKKS